MAARAPSFKATALASVVLLASAPVVWHLTSFERRIASYVTIMDRHLALLNASRPGRSHLDLPVYFVNMDANTDRRAQLEARLAGLSPPVEGVRIPGVDGRAYVDVPGVHSGFGWDSPGELGCTLSHLAAARRLVDDGHAAALVLEDDAHLGLARVWPVPLSELVQALPPGWTTLQLYHGTAVAEEPEIAAPQHTALVPYDRTAKVRSPGTVAYVLSRRGALGVLGLTDGGTSVHADKLRTRDGHADTVMYEFPYSMPYIVWPRYIFPYNDLRQSTSTIHASHTRHHLWHVRVASAILERGVQAFGVRAFPR